uniref:RING-type E3 ubiquitin transferase n=1 Tax=Kalanchoe fedtschenkoi TaxID=63787 RepID=A0A7N0TNU0_KALFE
MEEMYRIQYRVEQLDGPLAYSPPPLNDGSFLRQHHTSPASSSGSRISPAVLFIIVILAVLFFISGILHLLVRYLIKHPSSSSGPENSDSRYPELSESDALQRQLQQLFHLHDSGLDQAFIDALPVFHYKEIVGLKEPFDCAVCLCEFTEKDKLRLLPVCSHAFHIGCIDTWLLSNSTCPLCRGTLFAPGFSMENPMFDFDELREDDGFSGNGEIRLPIGRKTVEVEEIVSEKGVKAFPVRLGKFRKLTEGSEEKDVGETSSSNLDARRCFSMGSYQYIVGDATLRVPLSHDKGAGDTNTKLAKQIEHHGNPSFVRDMEGKKINSAAKKDSFSISKIWLWPKRGMPTNSSDAEMGHPSSLNSDFSWTRKSTQGP